MGNITTEPERPELLTAGDACFGRDFVGMRQGGRLFNIVNRREIRSIVAKYGIQAKHPLGLLAVAALLFVVAGVGFLMALRGLVEGRAIVLPAALAAGLVVPGVMCVRNAFIRGYYLDVLADSGCMRLFLAQAIRTSADLAAVVAVAAESGYLITIDASARNRD